MPNFWAAISSRVLPRMAWWSSPRLVIAQKRCVIALVASNVPPRPTSQIAQSTGAVCSPEWNSWAAIRVSASKWVSFSGQDRRLRAFVSLYEERFGDVFLGDAHAFTRGDEVGRGVETHPRAGRVQKRAEGSRRRALAVRPGNDDIPIGVGLRRMAGFMTRRMERRKRRHRRWHDPQALELGDGLVVVHGSIPPRWEPIRRARS